MPSVMDTIKWRDKWSRLTPSLRNTVITDTITWLEGLEKLKTRGEHLTHLVNFQNDLQNLLNQQKIPDIWFSKTAQTYGAFPFFANFLRRVL